MYVKKNSGYEILVSIKNVPASGSEGGTIEVTELDSPTKQYIEDRVDTPSQDYTYNRTAAKYEAVKEICDGDPHEFLTVFSDGTGTYCKGTAQTWKNEFSSGSAQEATLHIVATEIEDKTASEVTALLASSWIVSFNELTETITNNGEEETVESDTNETNDNDNDTGVSDIIYDEKELEQEISE